MLAEVFAGIKKRIRGEKGTRLLQSTWNNTLTGARMTPARLVGWSSQIRIIGVHHPLGQRAMDFPYAHHQLIDIDLKMTFIHSFHTRPTN